MEQHTQTTHPSKQAIREMLERRRAEHTPPPAPERIREQLGWWLIPENKRQAETPPVAVVVPAGV
jgi:hypothetical protein